MRPDSKIKLLLPPDWIPHSCLLQDEGEDYEGMLENCSFHLRRAGIYPGAQEMRLGFLFFSFLSAFLVFFGFHLIFTAFWSKFEFQKSEFHQSLIKLWVSKVWVLSKFDFWKSEFCQSLTFKSPSFVKVWLLKVWVLSKFDAKSLSFIKVWFFYQSLTKVRLLKVKLWQNSDFWKSNFDKTQTLKVWVSSNFDKTQTFKSQNLIKLWQNSDFWNSRFDHSNFDANQYFFWICFIFSQTTASIFSESDFNDIKSWTKMVSDMLSISVPAGWMLWPEEDLLTRQYSVASLWMAHHYG